MDSTEILTACHAFFPDARLDGDSVVVSLRPVHAFELVVAELFPERDMAFIRVGTVSWRKLDRSDLISEFRDCHAFLCSGAV